MLENQNVKELTTQEKINSVIDDYNDIAIEYSEEFDKEKYPKGKFTIMDMTNIDYPDNTFDGIMANCSLFHIPEELLSQTMESFKIILKNNGKLFLILQEGHEQKMVEEPYRHGV